MPDDSSRNTKNPSEKETGKALVIHPVLPVSMQKTERFVPEPEDKLEEVINLAKAIYLDVVQAELVNLSKITPATFLGKGVVERLGHQIKDQHVDLVVINHSLSPVQQRNLEVAWDTKVIDRTGLILEIFGERAETSEGKIQVELAALEYQRSRLVRTWTHLERQRGGLSFVGGPGETQLEIDRRLITERITKLKKDLEQVKKNRELQRQSRERVPYPIVALVGYTNAGKSTLFNRLTGADVFAKDLLFATLDPTMRKVELENGQEIIIADTVGFIADLPTHLVAAFRSTLEQVKYADIVLHVRDMSQQDHEAQRQEVIETLEDLDIEYDIDPRIIEVWNKIDVLGDDGRADVLRKVNFNERAVAVSALSGEGLGNLLSEIQARLAASRQTVVFKIPPADGEAIGWLYDNGHVLERKDDVPYITVTVDMEQADLGRFLEKYTYKPVGDDSTLNEESYG